MKKLIVILLISLFVLSCAANSTQRGAMTGAGAGTIASVIAGKDGSTAALLILGGALLGGAIGNIMDEQARQTSLQSQNRNKTVMVVEEEPTAKTNCTKVTKRKWKNGNMIGETVEEVCEGRKSSTVY